MKLLTIGRRRHIDTRAGPRRVEGALAPAFAEGHWRVPDRFNFTRDVVEALAGNPKREAAVCVGRDGIIEPRTFLQLSEAAARWAEQLREHGVQPGDRVLVVVGTCLDWLEVMLGAMKVGAVSVPCPETLSADALDLRLARSEARLAVAAPAAEAQLARAAGRPPVLLVEDVRRLAHVKPQESPTHDTSARDLAFILSTSGTAGEPKAVSHAHAAAFAARVQAEHWLDAGPRDVVWSTEGTGAPSAVWNVLLGPWSRGAAVVLHEGPFDPLERLDLVRRLGVTVLCQTPAEYRALAETGELARFRPQRLRRLVSTGDHLTPDLIAAFEEAWGLTVHDGYGQAETGIVAGHGPGAGFRSGSVGLPLPGFELAVIDDGGNRLPPGIEGDLALKGRPPSLFAGYWNAPEETKAAFRGDWYLTGDVAAADADGYLWLLGRAHDVIASAGRRFGPAEVEEALAGHPAVAEAGVVGMRDLERGGQFVRALVVLRPQAGASDRLAAEIREHVRQALPDHQVPRDIEFVDELPRTPDGKLRRLELRERPLAGPRPIWPAAPPPTWTLEPEPSPEPEAAGEPAPDSTPAPAAPSGTAPEPETAAEPERTAKPPVEAGWVPEAPVSDVAQALPPPATAVEPSPEQVAGPAAEAVTAPEPAPPAPETQPEPTPEPPPEPVPEAAVAASPEPTSVPSPEPASDPVTEPGLGPAPQPEPEPPLPEPVADTAPVPAERAVAEPGAPVPAAESVSDPAPVPPPEPEPLPEYIVPPREAPDPVPAPAPEPTPDLSAEPLPDYIVDPDRPPSGRAPRPEPRADIRQEEPPPDPLAGLWRPSGVQLPRATERPAPEENGPGRPEREDPPRRPRPGPDPGGRTRRVRSASEPGDELEETSWMQGLSSRLRAYSLAEDAARQPAAPPDEPAPDGNERA